MSTRLPEFNGTPRFELIRRLGAGGFGVVHEALDRERSTRVALKVLRSAEGTDLYRFKREFRALADIAHPNLVALDELLTDGTHWFFTMELVPGGTILSYVRGRTDGGQGDRPPAVTRLRHVLGQLVEALTVLHTAGIVHRDIKPSNVLVTPDGRVVVLDFGLVSEGGGAGADEDGAEQSSDGLSVWGSPSYMAPEQAGQWPVTPAADWYSVGVILYEALTGRLPFEGKGIEQIDAKQRTRARPPAEAAPDVPRDLSDLCVGLLEPDPVLRPGADAVRRVCGLTWPGGASGGAAPDGGSLVGREPHLAALADALRAAVGGETVVALVSGPSGIGKTALLRHFLAEQQQGEPGLLALTGRCYERESMPYKAIDPLVDALARHLQRLRDIEVARLLPTDAAILARVFPVLRAVHEIARAPEHAAGALDSIAVRRRAATALRDLLFDLAVRQPVVVVIDDAQWGDADSAAILREVLRPPDAPPLLLVAAFRSEDAAASPLVDALNRLDRDALGKRVRCVAVGALTADEAARLARQITPAEQRDEAFARSVADEARGSPFFVHELARCAARAGRPPRLADVVDERVRSLPAAARGLITAIALSAQAIPDRVAEAAAGIAPDDRDPLRQLRAARLVRAPGHGDERALEPYHDRIREAVIAHVPPAALAGEHRRLADAWERSGLARPETLATHWLGAGDEERTARYAAQAAERATDTLAFDRAAGFYRLLVRLERDRAQQRRWRVALGESLVNAGRGHEAALVYLDALALTAGTGDAPGGRATDDREDDDVELERRAAAEFIRAGYLDEATAVLARLLPRVGVSPPTSQPRAFATLAAYRALLLVRGLGFRERREADVPAADLRRIDVLVAIGPPMALMSLPLGLSLHVQGTWHALRVGEPKRVAVGLALLVSTLSPGGTRTFARASALAARARALAERHDDAWTIARTLLAEGICYKVSGYWTEGIERLERAIDRFTRCPGARWEIETAQTVRHDALIWTGDWRRLGGELAARWHDAEQRGDLYSAAHVAGRLNPLMLLAVDRPAEARAGAESAARHGNKPQHSMQQRAALCTWLDIELYDGRPAAAAARLKQSWRVLRGTLSLFQNGRIEAEFYRARIALALAARGERRFLTHAASSAKRLARERAGWAGALATLVRATLLYADGRTNAAVAELARAEQAFDACHMRLYAAAARYRRGRLTGSSDGAALADGARQSFIGEGVVNPERIIDLLAPGPW